MLVRDQKTFGMYFLVCLRSRPSTIGSSTRPSAPSPLSAIEQNWYLTVMSSSQRDTQHESGTVRTDIILILVSICSTRSCEPEPYSQDGFIFAVIVGQIDIKNESMLMAEACGNALAAVDSQDWSLWRGRLTGNHSSAKSSHAHDFAPVAPINSDRRPAFFAAPIRRAQLFHACTWMLCKPIFTACNLRGIQLGVAEVCPDRRDAHGIGLDAHLETTMHVCRNIQSCP